MLRKTLIAGAAVATGAALFAAPAGAAHGDKMQRIFTADLAELNDSGTTGEIRLEVYDQDKAVVTVVAEGAAPSLVHAQHVHGNLGQVSECPTIADDTGDDQGGAPDGFVSVAEGAPAYGAVNTALTTEGDTSAQSGLAVDRFPVAEADGTYTYERTFELDGDVATELGNFAVVLHGIDIDESGAYDGEKRSSLTDELPFEATVPAACGTLDLGQVLLPAPYDGTSGTEGTITRYYAALLNRAPDQSGFAYWNDTSATARTNDIIAAFTASEEFQGRFGEVLDAETEVFVDFVYISTLGRQPDPTGRAYWTAQIESGATTREAMVALFADSDEFQALTGTS